MTSISQLQISYSPLEDRVLLRMNTSGSEEFRFWLTRRFARLLHQVLRTHVATDPDVVAQPEGEAREAVRQFKQEAANASGNFSEPFREAGSFPLGTDPILAGKLSYRINAGKLALTLAPMKGRGVTVVLDEQLNFNITRLLKAACEKAAWAIDWNEAPPVGSDETRVIN